VQITKAGRLALKAELAALQELIRRVEGAGEVRAAHL
jgi:hypothetical protein